MRLDKEVRRVVENGNCTGCGGCAWLFPDLVSMSLDDSGFLRPRVQSRGTRGQAQSFKRVCPGVLVDQARDASASNHPVFGPYVSAWQGWSDDDKLRELGSSGGVLSAISSWLLAEAPTRNIVATAADPVNPIRSVALQLRSREDIEASAGSRYAPVSNLPLLGKPAAEDVFVGKPCEVVAARAGLKETGTDGQPVMLSFFCAGTPSQHATDELVGTLSGADRAPAEVRYRGNGWPGSFTVRDDDGVVASMSYHDSWGGHLGRALQMRCKLCPHGTGSHADIAVGDFWESDENGYPVFAEGEGNSVVIARTQRGHELIMRARSQGVLVLAPLDLDDVQGVQPLQVKRMRTLVGRMAGRVLAGKRVPTYRGFRLVHLATSSPLQTMRAAAGMWLRTIRRRPSAEPPRARQGTRS